MEEVVYQFLLQTAGYPRASIISDTSLVFKASDGRPAYLIVDPETAEPLAVIHVVGAVDASGLYAAAHAAEANKDELNRSTVQGFVVRIDFKGRTDKEKIQFYQTKAEGELYPLSASTFPDLDSLRVGSRLHGVISNGPSIAQPSLQAESLKVSDSAKHVTVDEEINGVESGKTSRLGLWLGLVLLVLTLADIILGRVAGEGWLQTSHSVLLVGAAFLFVFGDLKRRVFLS